MPKTEGRSYPIPDGAKYWSVTTVLGIIDKSGPLCAWAANQCAEYIKQKCQEIVDAQLPLQFTMEQIVKLTDDARRNYRKVTAQAADIGTQTHKCIEDQCKLWLTDRNALITMPEGLDKKVWNAFGLFLNWADDIDFTPVANELFVYSKTFAYAGTLDIIAKGKFTGSKISQFQVDIKTSKDFYETFGPQIAAYDWAYTELEHGEILDGLGVLRVGKEEGEPEFRDYTDRREQELKVFLAANELYKALKGNPK